MSLRNNRIIIAIITLMVMIIIIGIGYFSGFFFDSGITPCLPPPNLMVDGGAYARVYTWIDTNGNGLVDVGEKPLPKVEIVFPETTNSNNGVTDISGSANTYDFKAGCVCKCWEGSFIKINTPDGYKATTATTVKLSGDDQLIKFGFIKIQP